MTLWHGRGADDVDAALEKSLGWIADNLNAAGCWDYNDPWGYVDCAGYVDHPLGRSIIASEIPIILRGQAADGGWGNRSFRVFRALHKYGFLGPLRALPPLPPDWRVVRSIPSPCPRASQPASAGGTTAWPSPQLTTPLCRQRGATGGDAPAAEMSAWPIPYASFHVPTHFGVATFE